MSNDHSQHHTPILWVIIFLAVFLLTGCSPMNSTFTCPMKPGQMCRSLDEVNAMVDQGQIGKLASQTSSPSLSNQSSQSLMPIWIAPYEDQAGNHYSSSLVYPKSA